MKRLLALVFSLTFSLAALAQVPQPPEVAARSYLLLDVTSNQILAAKDIDSPVEPASITKLMTCLLYTSPSPRDKRQSRMPSSA